MSYERISDSTLRYTYIIGVWVKKIRTIAILCLISAETILHQSQLLSNLLLLASLSLFIACLSYL